MSKGKLVLMGMAALLLSFSLVLTACPTDGNNNEPPEPPEQTTYTVTFNVDGGSAVPNQTVEEGKKVVKPENPTKADYTFANWYKDTAKETLWNFDTDVVVQDTTIYAKWVQGENVESFKVTFDAAGGSPAPAEQTVVKGEQVSKPTDPTKSGYIFDGWYNAETKWDFSTTVTAAITLTAKWIEAVTVTFNPNGGTAFEPVTVAKGEQVYLGNYKPSKDGHVFDGWYTDVGLETPADNNLTVTANTTLYAKWTSTSTLALYAGVWRSNYTAYWLQGDGTAWIFYSDGDFYKTTWSTSKIDGDDVVFNETQFTLGNNTYTKNTSQKKTPAAAAGTLLGTWGSGSETVELKADKTAVLTYHDDVITLNYCVETNAVYLLAPDNDNLVIVSISITDGKLNSFSKLTSDTTLAGIWKLTEGGQDFYWTLDKDGNGTFHTLGASLPVSFTVTEDKEIDGSPYTFTNNNNTLTLSEGTKDEVTLTKVDTVPSGTTGYGGDNRLHGTWKMIQGDETMTLIFKNDGTLSVEMKEGDTTTDSYSYIWKADGSTFSMYNSSFGSSGSGGSYTISGSSLSFGGMEFIKQ
jgi:uncharacterized repeat protein (TIGR02543 family)